MGGANGSRECAPDDKLRDTHHGPNDGDGFREALNPSIGYPTGKSLRLCNCGVSSPFLKNISVFPKYKSGYMSSHPVPLRGALRNVTNAGRGCGGRGWRS
jgi:hypothetical protein